MLQRADSAVSGSGGNNCEIGTITVTTGEQTFNWQSLKQKPTKLFVYKMSNPIANGNMTHIYDTDLSSSVQYRVYESSNYPTSEIGSFPNTTADWIQDITASGFTLKTSSALWIGTYTYVAVV